MSSSQQLHPFFSRSAKPQVSVKWQQKETLLIGQVGALPNPLPEQVKLASFDLDDTLITTCGTHIFMKHAHDYKFLFPCVLSMLSTILPSHLVVIFSNQKGLAQKPARLAMFKEKVQAIMNDISTHYKKEAGEDGSFCIILLAAMENDHYRKPRRGMWDYYLEHYLEMNAASLKRKGIQLDMEQSWFVGDAAGRPVSPGRTRKDHSDTDLKFAKNVGIPFYTPEQYFLKQDVGVDYTSLLSFIPSQLIEKRPRKEPLSYALDPSLDITDAIIFVGSPASGKTTFYETHFAPQGYHHINQDTLKSREKCLKLFEECLASRIPCIVDNTNPNKETRQLYLQVAKKYPKAAVRCFHFATTKQVCLHNNWFRSLYGDRERLSEMVFGMYFKNLDPPDIKEGFTNVTTIDFVPRFEDAEIKEKWLQFFI